MKYFQLCNFSFDFPNTKNDFFLLKKYCITFCTRNVNDKKNIKIKYGIPKHI